MLIYLTLLTLKKIFSSGASNERDLIKKIRQRNLKALESLYDRYAKIIYSFILAVVHEKKIASKLTKNLFLLIWQKAESFNTKTGNVYRWLLTLTQKIILNKNTINQPEQSLKNMTLSDQLITQNGKKSKLDASKASKRSKIVKKVFKDLPKEEQEVIRLAYYNGLKQDDIAQTLHVPKYEVKRYMREGMNSIVASLYDY